jgi:hypothetical protein
LAFNVELPELIKMPPVLRKMLGSAYEKFGRKEWRDGFEDACLSLETECRNYLLKGLKSGRIVVLKKNGQPESLTVTKVKRMTLGQLADVFSRIQSQNHVDSLLAGSLKAINPDRILVAHRRRSAAAERRLRRFVPKQMWVVINALQAMKQ